MNLPFLQLPFLWLYSLDALRPAWNGLQEQRVLHWAGIATLWYLLMNINNAWCGGTRNRMALKEEAVSMRRTCQQGIPPVGRALTFIPKTAMLSGFCDKTRFLKIAQKQVFFWYDLIFFPWLSCVSAHNVRLAVALETGIIIKNV